MACWHRLGERCRCGHLTVPARFYWETKNEKLVEVSQEKAEAAYLASLEKVNPALWEKLKPVTKMGRDEIPVTNNVTRQRTVLPSRPSPRPRGLRRGRPKKHADQAARQKAYRGRHGA